MKLAHPARLDLHQRRRDGARRREVGRVGDAHLAPCHFDWLLGRHVVAKGLRHDARARLDHVRGHRARHLAREDVALVLDVDGDVGEGGLWDAEVLGQHVTRRVLEQVGEQEGLVLREGAVVEDQQELTAVFEPLEGVGNHRREVPQVTLAHVVDEGASLLVDGGDAAAAGEHVRPLGLLVPVQLADAPGLQAHVDPGELGGDRQLAHRHLARPAARDEAVARGGEGELEVGDRAGVGIGGGQQVRILALQGHVVRPQNRRAQAILDRLRQAVGGASACAGFLLYVSHQHLSSCTLCTLDVSKLVAACWQQSCGSCLSSQGPGMFGVPTSLCSMPAASAWAPRGRDTRTVESRELSSSVGAAAP